MTTYSRASKAALVGIAVLAESSGPCWAADATASGGIEIGFLSEVMILVLVGGLLAEGMQRLGQPSVMGPLIGGLLLGPSMLGALWPSAEHAFLADPQQKAAVSAFAQFGVLLLLLLAGMETELRLLQRIGRTAVAVSIAGIMLPFVFGLALGELLPAEILPHPDRRVVAALFVGIALSISSVKIVAMVVREMNFARRNVGAVILAAAVIDDTIGWMLLAIVFSLAGRGTLDAQGVAVSTLGTLAFLGVSMLIGRRLVPRLIRWANDLLASEGAVLAVILLLMGGMALVTHWIGVHTVLGAFVAGMLVGESPMLTGEIDRQLRGIIAALVVPVFFGLAGLDADLTILRDPKLLGLTGLLILIASMGKFAGAFGGGRLGGMTTRESLALACGMNARGSTEVIVATVGLSMGILSQQLFTMIVAMAVITTLAMPPMLRWALRQLPLQDEERERIDRQHLEEHGLLANIERILVAVDESANAEFTSRLVGLFAGTQGIPATVLHFGSVSDLDLKGDGSRPEAAVEAGVAAAVEATRDDPEETGSGLIDISSRKHKAGTAATIAEEAGKGYGLLAIGLRTVTFPDGAFRHRIAAAAAGFEGPLMIVRARGRHLREPRTSGFRIVLPVTGTDVSRRAAEIAVALARAANVSISAIHASSEARGKSEAHEPRRAMRAHEEQILHDVETLAQLYGVAVETTLRHGVSAEDAIMHAAGRAGDLIVMGANRRSGSPLYLGQVATAVLQGSRASVAVVTN